MKHSILTIICFLFFQLTAAQSINAKQVLPLFLKGQEVTLSVPISQTQNLSLVCKPRESSAADIRTFVIYLNDNLAGALSVFEEKISGSFSYKNRNIKFQTDKNGEIIFDTMTLQGTFLRK